MAQEHPSIRGMLASKSRKVDSIHLGMINATIYSLRKMCYRYYNCYNFYNRYNFIIRSKFSFLLFSIFLRQNLEK